MTTTRDFVDSDLHCPLDGKLMVIEQRDGADVHACLNCDYREAVDAAGFVSELDPARPVWPTEPCSRCGAAVVWATTVNYRRMPVDAAPSQQGVFSLHSVAGQVQAQYDFGHPMRRLYRHHSKTCTGRAVAS